MTPNTLPSRLCRLNNVRSNINNQTMSEWVRATAMHEHQAFEKLYTATSPTVFNILKRMLYAESLAEKALQEVFLKVWNKAESFDGRKCSPKTWIISIARHHAIDVLRKHPKREDVALTQNTLGRAKFRSPSTTRTYRNEQPQELIVYLEHLNNSAEEYVVRAYCEGFSYEELSKKTQHPVYAIKRSVRKSLLSLKGSLDGL